MLFYRGKNKIPNINKTQLKKIAKKLNLMIA